VEQGSGAVERQSGTVVDDVHQVAADADDDVPSAGRGGVVSGGCGGGSGRASGGRTG